MNFVMVNLTSGLFHLESFKSKSVHVLRQSENTSVFKFRSDFDSEQGLIHAQSTFE